MKKLSKTSELQKSYFAARDTVNKRSCMMFDNMSLREVCNKIIHADVVEPHFRNATESHKIDEYNMVGFWEAQEMSPNVELAEPEPIVWEHLTYNIRLGGTHRGKQWWHLLMLPVFIEVISDLFV